MNAVVFRWVSLWKGGEVYAVFFRRSDQAAALAVIGRWASDPELSFSWYDAAVLSWQVRQG
jgi:hypothetical protein